MFGEMIESIKVSFVNTVNITDPINTIGHILGASAGIAVIAGAVKATTMSTKSVLTGDLTGLPQDVIDGVKHAVDTDLAILEAIKPTKKGSRARRARYKGVKARPPKKTGSWKKGGGTN